MPLLGSLAQAWKRGLTAQSLREAVTASKKALPEGRLLRAVKGVGEVGLTYAPPLYLANKLLSPRDKTASLRGTLHAERAMWDPGFVAAENLWKLGSAIGTLAIGPTHDHSSMEKIGQDMAEHFIKEGNVFAKAFTGLRRGIGSVLTRSGIHTPTVHGASRSGQWLHRAGAEGRTGAGFLSEFKKTGPQVGKATPSAKITTQVPKSQIPEAKVQRVSGPVSRQQYAKATDIPARSIKRPTPIKDLPEVQPVSAAESVRAQRVTTPKIRGEEGAAARARMADTAGGREALRASRQAKPKAEAMRSRSQEAAEEAYTAPGSTKTDFAETVTEERRRSVAGAAKKQRSRISDDTRARAEQARKSKSDAGAKADTEKVKSQADDAVGDATKKDPADAVEETVKKSPAEETLKGKVDEVKSAPERHAIEQWVRKNPAMAAGGFLLADRMVSRD